MQTPEACEALSWHIAMWLRPAQVEACESVRAADYAALTYGVYVRALYVSVVSAVLSGFIALVAVRSPERDRWVRDFEDRKKRARLYTASATAGVKALSVVNDVRRYINGGHHLIATGEEVIEMRRALQTQVEILSRFLSLGIRDADLVSMLEAARSFTMAVRDGMRGSLDLLDPVSFEGATSTFKQGREEMKRLIGRLWTYRASKIAKDASLQRDLTAVTRLWWYPNLLWSPRTPRD